jgi:hypothetical protein
MNELDYIDGGEYHVPLSVAIIFDIIFALAKSVPKFDCFVARTRDNLSVVGAKANGQDIGCVANEATCSGTGIEVPQTECVVPRGREGELAIRGNHDIRNEVVVSFEDSFWVAKRVFVTSQLPDDDRLV